MAAERSDFNIFYQDYAKASRHGDPSLRGPLGYMVRKFNGIQTEKQVDFTKCFETADVIFIETANLTIQDVSELQDSFKPVIVVAGGLQEGLDSAKLGSRIYVIDSSLLSEDKKGGLREFTTKLKDAFRAASLPEFVVAA